VLESAVNEGDAGELIRVKRDLDQERAGRKKDQTRVAELEDENRRLKAVPVPSVVAAAEPVKKSWLKGATFFDGAD